VKYCHKSAPPSPRFKGILFFPQAGKEHEVPCHHNLEQYLDAYIAAAGIAADRDGPLFRTAAGKTGTLTGNAMWQQDAYRMIQRRAAAADIKTPDRQSYLSGDRDHGVSQKQRPTGTCANARQSRLASDDQALRSPAG
jgi:hypothetical protein